MRCVIQRVKHASVTVDREIIGQIDQGLLVLFAVHVDDTDDKIEKMAQKILKLRIFEDKEGKMNRSVTDYSGSILVVSQFTLYGDATSGNRPSFIESARPEKAIPMYEAFIEMLKQSGLKVETGRFGAEMDVALVNDGPVTILMDT